MRRITSLLRWNRAWRAAPVAVAWAMALALPAMAASVPIAAGPRGEALPKPAPQTNTTPTIPTTPTTTPTTPSQPQTTPTPPTTPAPATTTPSTQPTTAPYTPPATTHPTTAPAAPVTTPTPAPVVHRHKPSFHFDPPRVRLTDFGVAQRGAVAPLPAGASAAGDPSASTNRAKLIVLIAVGAGMLLALAAVARLALLRRRAVAVQPRRSQINGGRFPAGRDHFRVYGDRMRVTLDERGADVLVLGLGLAAAVAIGALLAG